MIGLLLLSSLVIKHSASPPTVDGIVTTEEWSSFLIVDSLCQNRPEWGNKATEETKVYAMTTNKALYIAVECFDKDIAYIKATGNERDSKAVLEDDNILIILDTFGEGTIAYGFCVNPLGTQYDLKLASGGIISSAEWDGRWKSLAAVSDDRWSLEIMLNFVDFDYTKGHWRFNVARFIARKDELSIFNLANSGFDLSKTVEASFKGIDNIEEATAVITLLPHCVLKKKDNTSFLVGEI